LPHGSSLAQSGSGSAAPAGVVVALATVALFAVLAIWACVTPDYRAPDEPQQVSTTLRLAYLHSYPAPGDATIFPPVKASYSDVGFGGIGLNTIIGLNPLPRPTEKQLSQQTLRQLGAGATGAVTPYDYDQMTQHPPGYFAVMAVAARVFDVIDKTPRTALLILRLCSALLLLPLPFLTSRIARTLGLSPSGAAAASFLPIGLPQLMHLGGAVNNDVLTITLGAAVTWLALEVAGRARVRPWALALGFAMTAMLLTKGVALPMLVVVAAAFLLRGSRFGFAATSKYAALSLVCMLPGLAWWVANVVRFGTLQPNGYPKSYLDLLPTGHIGFGSWLHGFVPAMARSFFADFGWLEAPPPPLVTALASAAVALLVVIGVLRSRDRLGEVLVAQLSWVMPLIAILDTSHAASDRTGALQGVQGRYIFAGVAAIAATIALALRPGIEPATRRRRAGQGSYALLPIAAAALAIVGLVAGVSHFYLGNGLSGELGTFTAWSPLRLRVLVPIAGVGLAAALTAAVLLLTRDDAPDYPHGAATRYRAPDTSGASVRHA
jgi:Predicted membrane protein (DUF2142)